MSDDYYNILNISKDASDKDIKKAYRKLAVKWHPDKNKSKKAEDKFKEINEAYAVLGDKDKKIKYDKFGKAGLDPNLQSNMGGIDPNDIFNSFFGASGFTGSMFGSNGFGGMPFSGMPNRPNNRKRPKGPSKRTSITITFKDMMCGLKKKFAVNRKVKCSKCDGNGLKLNCSPQKCIHCNGKGMVTHRQVVGPGMITERRSTCHMCRGEGKIIKKEHKCLNCNGLKYVDERKIISLTIPSGTENGQIFTIENMADENEKWHEAGDLEFVVNVKPEKYMRRVGNDLHIDKAILLKEALTGLDLVIEHLDGSKIVAHSDEIINPYKKYRLYNLGFNYNGKLGDIILSFHIIFPKYLNSQRKEILNKILPVRKHDIEVPNDIQRYDLLEVEDDYEDNIKAPEEFINNNPAECAQQ